MHAFFDEVVDLGSDPQTMTDWPAFDVFHP
jgi:hypothetical protein